MAAIRMPDTDWFIPNLAPTNHVARKTAQAIWLVPIKAYL